MRRMTDRAARGRNRQRTRRRAKTFREPTAICEIQSNSPQSDVCRDAPSHTNDEMGISRVGHSGQGERTAHKRTHRNRHSRNMPNKRFQATPAPRTCCGPPSCRGCTKATVLKTPSMVTMRLPRKARQNLPLPIVLERSRFIAHGGGRHPRGDLSQGLDGRADHGQPGAGASGHGRTRRARGRGGVPGCGHLGC